MAITPEEFRQALGHFASGVTVITVGLHEGPVHGMTANAFTSVSLEPPLVLVCVDHRARTLPQLQAQACFGVNVGREGQQVVAQYYADPTHDHANPEQVGVRYAYSECGTPLLEPCLAQLDCRIVAAHEAGDHIIFVA